MYTADHPTIQRTCQVFACCIHVQIPQASSCTAHASPNTYVSHLKHLCLANVFMNVSIFKDDIVCKYEMYDFDVPGHCKHARMSNLWLLSGRGTGQTCA